MIHFFKHIFGGGERGAAAVLFMVLLTAIILTIGLSLGTLFVGDLRLLGGVGDSVVALVGADAGIERILRVDDCLTRFSRSIDETARLDCLEEVIGIRPNISPPQPNAWQCGNGSPGPPFDANECRESALENFQDAFVTLPQSGINVTYEAEIVTSLCSGANFCARSTGTFKNAERRAEIVR